MAEVIEFREFQAARERAQRRRSEHQSLARAVAKMRDSLAAVADQMRTEPEDGQAELLDRAEKLIAMVRYGMRMMGEDTDPAAMRGSR